MHEVCTTHWWARVLIPASGFCLHNHVCYFIKHSSFTADFLSLRWVCYQFYPLHCSSTSPSWQSVCLFMFPPLHIMQQEEVIDTSEGRIGLLGDWREVPTRVQWLLSVHYLCSRVVWLDLSTLKCVFVSRSEIYWPRFLPSKPSHRYTFILMLHFHYQMLSKALKHHPNTDLLLTYFDYMIRDLLKALN